MDVEIPGPSYFVPLSNGEPLPGPSSACRKRVDKVELVATHPKRSRTTFDDDFLPTLSSDEEDVPPDVVFSDDEVDVIDFMSFMPKALLPEPEPVVKYRQVLRHIPSIPHVRITNSDGSRVYLRVFPEKEVDLSTVVNQKKLNLLGVPFLELRKQATMSKNRFHETLAEVVDTESLGLGVDGDLWVEKYKPKSYLDLLSEETLNHNLLHWLKIWDKTVFGNDYLHKYKETKERYALLEAKEKEKEESKFGYKPQQPAVKNDGYDEGGFPKQKIALLHGPPGLGKTTCAHIVAKHAGYKVIEMNASDDRSVEILRRTLDSALQNRPEVFQDGRPNCLIIDEIDGAPTDTINVLVDLVTGKAVEKGKKKNKKQLRRPIICICNDLFAVSLRNLRPHAVILSFPPIMPKSLVDRLRDISCKEDLSLDSGVLHKLAERTDCDIRSCLSSMQFLKNYQGTAGISNTSIFDQIAKKDKNKGIFAVWDEIFKMPIGKSDDPDDPTKPGARFKNILSTVQSFGDYEKLKNGVFENYLGVKFKDSFFQVISNGLLWLTWFEELKNKMERLQNYSLMAYLPMYFVQCHFLYASKNFVKLNYPNAEGMKKATKCQDIIKTQLSDVSPQVGRFLDQSSMIIDVVPALVTILQPGTIRPISTQLWSNRERETVSEIVTTMIAYNLNYTQQKQEDGTYSFTLDPNIDDIANFQLQGVSRPQFPYTVKQLVAREITMEKLRRDDPQTHVQNVTPQPTSSTVPGNKGTQPMDTKPLVKAEVSKPAFTRFKSVSDMLDKNAKPVIQPKDFFGRPIIRNPDKEKVEAEQKQTGDIWYKFKEGFSNAVRRNLKLKDFL